MTRYEVDREHLAAALDGMPSYRVDQVWKGLYEQLKTPHQMTNLPLALREQLDADLPLALAETIAVRADGGDTTKYLWTLHDSEQIETVLMHYRDRSTVCVSTQAGCAMGCTFCATGQAGYDRNLTVGEIVEQVVVAARTARDEDRRLSNVVFMGMGEPLANFDNLWGAIERIHGDLGLSARHLTVSTVGLIPGIAKLADAPLPVNLAVSLHAANDELRNSMIPIGKRYPLDDLIESCRAYFDQTHRRVSFEWAMIAGVNDRRQDVEELAEAARRVRAHVNLIPLNPTPGYPTEGTSPERVRWFRDELRTLGTNATVRQNRGTDIDAACGQLRANQPVQIRRK